MDIAVTAIAGAAILILVAATIIAFIRWRRNRYRFSLKAMLVLFALLGCTMYVIMQFVVPAITHRVAVQRIYYAGGLLFRDDYQRNSGQVYSDPRTANPWRDVAILHARNNAEALTVASQLKYLPETETIALGSTVTDQGLIAICDREPAPSLDTLDMFDSRVTANGLSHLAKLTQLRTLFFNTCPLDDTCLSTLKTLGNLRHLTLLEEGKSINPNRFTEAGFRELGEMKNLESLWLVRMQISPTAANHLKNLTELKKLQLSRCLISDESIADLRQALPNCELKTSPPDWHVTGP